MNNQVSKEEFVESIVLHSTGDNKPPIENKEVFTGTLEYEELLEDTMQEEYNKQYQVDPNEEQVNNPTHYQSMVPDLNIDAISCMRAAFGNEEVASFCICNALKYIFRHQSKNGKTDILKAVWYLNKYLELNK